MEQKSEHQISFRTLPPFSNTTLGILRGGLGNQLFQITAYRALAKLKRRKLVVDINNFSHPKQVSLGRKLEIQAFLDMHSVGTRASKTKFFSRLWTFLFMVIRLSHDALGLSNISSSVWASEKDDAPKHTDLKMLDLKYLDGYFAKVLDQPEYVESYNETVAWLLSLLADKKAPNSIDSDLAIHVRLTDFSQEKKSLLNSPTVRRLIWQHDAKGGRLIIFSDDPVGARELIGKFDQSRIVEADITASAIDTLLELARRPKIIASYSTFSWWAGLLASKIGSQIFFPYLRSQGVVRDDELLVPKNWIRF